MKIFLDTAEVGQIIDGYKTGLIDGVTTNPTLILRSGRQQSDVIEEIFEACPNLESISAEVVANTAEEMVEQAQPYIDLSSNVTIYNSQKAYASTSSSFASRAMSFYDE